MQKRKREECVSRGGKKKEKRQRHIETKIVKGEEDVDEWK